MKKKSKIQSNLVFWQKLHDLVLEDYRITKQFPKEEIFGLTYQLRKAAISIPANNLPWQGGVDEGFTRTEIKDKLRFYNINAGSKKSCYLLLSKELGYTATSDILKKVEEIGKILNSYTKYMQA